MHVHKKQMNETNYNWSWTTASFDKSIIYVFIVFLHKYMNFYKEKIKASIHLKSNPYLYIFWYLDKNSVL